MEEARRLAAELQAATGVVFRLEFLPSNKLMMSGYTGRVTCQPEDLLEWIQEHVVEADITWED